MTNSNLTVGLKLVKNNTSTAADAPYLGMAIPVGSLAYDNILTAMLDNQTFMSKATAQYFLKALFEYAAETIAEDVVRISTGTVSLYPAISGSFDSEDAAFDPLRNALYVGASFSQSLRDAVATVTPERESGDSTTTVAIHSVMDVETETFKTIRGTNDFRIAGINLTVPDGADESLALYSKDLLTKVCDIVTSETDGGQRITCHLPGTATIAKGAYKIRLASHGIDPTDPLTVTTTNVTVTEAVVPPPSVTKSKQGELADNTNQFSSTPIVLTGNFPGGFQTGDQLELNGPEGSTPGEYQTTISYEDDVTASDETEIHLGNGIENKRETQIPTSEWIGHNAQWVFRRNGVSYPLVVSWVA